MDRIEQARERFRITLINSDTHYDNDQLHDILAQFSHVLDFLYKTPVEKAPILSRDKLSLALGRRQRELGYKYVAPPGFDEWEECAIAQRDADHEHYTHSPRLDREAVADALKPFGLRPNHVPNRHLSLDERLDIADAILNLPEAKDEERKGKQ